MPGDEIGRDLQKPVVEKSAVQGGEMAMEEFSKHGLGL